MAFFSYFLYNFFLFIWTSTIYHWLCFCSEKYIYCVGCGWTWRIPTRIIPTSSYFSFYFFFNFRSINFPINKFINDNEWRISIEKNQNPTAKNNININKKNQDELEQYCLWEYIHYAQNERKIYHAICHSKHVSVSLVNKKLQSLYCWVSCDWLSTITRE